MWRVVAGRDLRAEDNSDEYGRSRRESWKHVAVAQKPAFPAKQILISNLFQFLGASLDCAMFYLRFLRIMQVLQFSCADP